MAYSFSFRLTDEERARLGAMTEALRARDDDAHLTHADTVRRALRTLADKLGMCWEATPINGEEAA